MKYMQWLNSARTGRNGVPPPVSGVPPPEVVVPPPGMTFRHQLGETIKIVATRGQILRFKCTKYYFGGGSTPDPSGDDYSSQSEPLAGSSGRGQSTSKGIGGREGEKRRGQN